VLSLYWVFDIIFICCEELGYSDQNWMMMLERSEEIMNNIKVNFSDGRFLSKNFKDIILGCKVK